MIPNAISRTVDLGAMAVFIDKERIIQQHLADKNIIRLNTELPSLYFGSEVRQQFFLSLLKTIIVELSAIDLSQGILAVIREGIQNNLRSGSKSTEIVRDSAPSPPPQPAARKRVGAMGQIGRCCDFHPKPSPGIPSPRASGYGPW